MREWIGVVQSVVVAFAAAAVALLYRGFQTGKWVRQIGEERDQQIDDIHRRLDTAGGKMSDLANEVQTMPDRFRREFVSREVFDLEKAVDKERREEFRESMTKEHDKLWAALRTRRNG